ncbi:unnamed protein product [Adineta ricciae]|uniref:Uncharacterized protein n=1 Tax=Adineta ricciae TaxID=249248 RepID=A0A815MD08_ADIRI|nr:unnamed protein product [Adineta ricciae]CAF1644051.1 unnamed protein product [Adineta ricciae]
MEKTPPSPSPSSSSTKRSFQRKKLQYQERITEQSPSSSFPTITTLMPTYLTTDSIRKVSPTNILSNLSTKQEMELKTVGKLGMVKRKQFLQKRDISRSHERGIPLWRIEEKM